MRTFFHEYIDSLQAGKNVTTRQIKYLCKCQYPWPIKNPVDWWCVQWILSYSEFLPFDNSYRLWLNRKYNFNRIFLEVKNIIVTKVPLIYSLYKLCRKI